MIGAVLFIVVGILVISAQTGQSVSDVLNKIAPGNISSTVSGYVQDFVTKKGIEPGNIQNVSQVDFNALPKEVNIKNVGNNNLAIYQVNYSQNNQNKQVFVVTYSVEKLRSQGDLIVSSDKRNFLDFGHSGVMSNSGFLETSAGVETSASKGYVMVRDGSITAISTNLEVIQGNPGEVDIVILKNGQPISFGNALSADKIGVKKGYDVQEKDTVNFKAGDVISVLAKKTGDVAWRDVITMVEITTND